MRSAFFSDYKNLLPCHFEWREAPREIFLNFAIY